MTKAHWTVGKMATLMADHSVNRWVVWKAAMWALLLASRWAGHSGMKSAVWWAALTGFPKVA